LTLSVEHFDSSPPRELVLRLHWFEQILDRLRIVDMNDYVDGLVDHVDVAVEQEAGDDGEIDLALHSRQARKRRLTYELVGVLERVLQGPVHFGCLEA
jgi:hypothetical protein